MAYERRGRLDERADPPSVARDAVDEASCESMVASDPPARGLVRTGEPRREPREPAHTARSA